MFTENSNPRKRGRPRGRTPDGEAARRRLYETAIALIAEQGYEGATLREVADRANVSPALLYRYFPNKRAVVLALNDELSESFAQQAVKLPEGKWRDRALYALELSLHVLGPHRAALRALAPILAADAEQGVFARSLEFSRLRVQAVFERAVTDASDAPSVPLARAAGRLLYLVHLGVILWWLLDRSPQQRATSAVIALIQRGLPSLSAALYLPSTKKFVLSADALFTAAQLRTGDGEA